MLRSLLAVFVLLLHANASPPPRIARVQRNLILRTQIRLQPWILKSWRLGKNQVLFSFIVSRFCPLPLFLVSPCFQSPDYYSYQGTFERGDRFDLPGDSERLVQDSAQCYIHYLRFSFATRILDIRCRECNRRAADEHAFNSSGYGLNEFRPRQKFN